MEKKRKVITFRAESLDREAIETIREYYGLSSDNQAISFALREIQRRVQKGTARSATHAAIPPPS